MNLKTTPTQQEPKAPVTGWRRRLALGLQQLTYLFAKYWFGFFMAAAILFLMAGLLAPALAAEGYDQAANIVYGVLSTQNHQLPQRSYFLMAQTGFLESYSLDEVIAFGADPARLQRFKGNAEIGYKMALNQRMVAIFLGIVIGGFVWALRKGRPRLSLIQLLLFSLPLLVDGFTHLASDGGSGFRLINGWAILLTGNALSETFYSGTTVGSLNWWLRTVTGLLFGLGLVWFSLPRFSNYFLGVRRRLWPKLQRTRG